MQEQTITARVKSFIGQKFPLAKSVSNDANLLENGLVDSLGILEVVSFVEQEFQIALADDELTPANFQSVESIATFVESKRNGTSRHSPQE